MNKKIESKITIQGYLCRWDKTEIGKYTKLSILISQNTFISVFISRKIKIDFDQITHIEVTGKLGIYQPKDNTKQYVQIWVDPRNFEHEVRKLAVKNRTHIMKRYDNLLYTGVKEISLEN